MVEDADDRIPPSSGDPQDDRIDEARGGSDGSPRPRAESDGS